MKARTLAVIAVFCPLVMPAQTSQGVNFYSLEKEKALGASLAEDLRKRQQVADDAFLQGYLASILARVETQAQSPFPLHLAIIADAKPAIEPVTFPGGYMFVPVGMIAAAEDEGALARAMAHGLAHIARRHGTRMATRGQIANLSTIPLIFVGGWHGAGDERLLIPTAFAEFHRRNEAEADQLAAEWMASFSGSDSTQFAAAKQRAFALLPAEREPKPPTLRRP